MANASDKRLYFAADAGDGARATGWLDPGARLCSPDAESSVGVVSAFIGPGDLEGCSRLAAAGRVQRLLDYGGIDRCRWRIE